MNNTTLNYSQLIEKMKQQERIDREWLRAQGIDGVNTMNDLYEEVNKAGYDMQSTDCAEWRMVELAKTNEL